MATLTGHSISESADIGNVDDAIVTHAFAQLRIQRLSTSPNMYAHVIILEARHEM